MKSKSTPKLPSKPSFIAYYRTSTAEQTAGLEAQRNSIRSYIKANDGILAGEFEEHLTGTGKKKRVEVYKAVAQALQTGSTLIVHKVDRLARDMNFWQEIKRSNVKFLSLDNPGQSEMITNILLSIAEAEANWMKKRQLEAYTQLKANGDKFGDVKTMKNPELRKKALAASIATRKELSSTKNSQVLVHICKYRNGGDTWYQIAKTLNTANHKTSRGKEFQASTVKQLYEQHCI